MTGKSARRPTFTLTFAKEDFKFSSAHFTLFGPDQAELLHGHNYRVRLELSGGRLDEDGLLVGFEQVKGHIRAICRYLDSRTLIPVRSRHLIVREESDRVEVRFGARAYVLPSEDVLLLPIVNTSMECLARLIWCELVRSLPEILLPEILLPEVEHAEALMVEVSETTGQSCRFQASPAQLDEIAAEAGSLEGWR